MGFEVRPVDDRDRSQVEEALAHWGAGVARLGELVPASATEALVAMDGGHVGGVCTYALRGDECEVVTLDALPPGNGAGWVLLDAVRTIAAAAGCRRLWLVTTNDNTRALRFYQRWGMDLVALHRGGVDRARSELKPGIPPTGEDGIALRHELELELLLP